MRLNRRAFTVIEVMVGSAIVIIAALAVSSFLGSSFRQQKYLRLQQTRDAIGKRVAAALSDPRAYFISAMNNPPCAACTPALRNCIFGGAVCNDSANGIPFNLLQSYADTADDVVGTPIYQLSGGPGAGFRWSVDGEPGCAGTDRQCPFQVETVFRPQQPIAGQALGILAKYRVIDSRFGNAAAAAERVLGKLLQPEPPWTNPDPADGNWRTVDWESASSVDTRKILKFAASAPCDAGKFLVGYDRFGNPICRCLNTDNNTNEDANQNPDPACRATCVTASALPNVQGLSKTPDGSTESFDDPDRRLPHPTRLLCFASADLQKMTECINEQSGLGTGGCPANSWLVKVEFGTCRRRAATKTDPQAVDCDQNIGKCCKIRD